MTATGDGMMTCLALLADKRKSYRQKKPAIKIAGFSLRAALEIHTRKPTAISEASVPKPKSPVTDMVG